MTLDTSVSAPPTPAALRTTAADPLAPASLAMEELRWLLSAQAADLELDDVGGVIAFTDRAGLRQPWMAAWDLPEHPVNHLCGPVRTQIIREAVDMIRRLVSQE